ncbi:hypothetical protein EON68_01185 [archaeon]|nr:MAG: hypothetical protein EON68_01185 [archaeon]
MGLGTLASIHCACEGAWVRAVHARARARTCWPCALHAHFACRVQSALQPGLSKSAQEVLMRYYELQRRTDSRSAARTTLRLLESLVRLAQAHARLMWRTEAGVQDAVMAVVLVETSMHTSAMLGVSSVLHSQCPTVRCTRTARTLRLRALASVCTRGCVRPPVHAHGSCAGSGRRVCAAAVARAAAVGFATLGRANTRRRWQLAGFRLSRRLATYISRVPQPACSCLPAGSSRFVRLGKHVWRRAAGGGGHTAASAVWLTEWWKCAAFCGRRRIPQDVIVA